MKRIQNEKLKGFVILSIFLSITTILFAQKCKYEVNEVDKFTGELTKITKPEKIIVSYFISGDFSFKKAGENHSIILDYYISSYKKFDPFNIEKGARLVLLLENGESINLSTPDNIIGTKRVVVGIPPTHICTLKNISYPINKSQIDMLIQSKVVSVRFYRSEGNGKESYEDANISEKHQQELKNLIMCIL